MKRTQQEVDDFGGKRYNNGMTKNGRVCRQNARSKNIEGRMFA